MEQLEAEIEHLETRIGELDASLADPDIWSDADAYQQLHAQREALQRDLDPYEQEWSRRVEQS